MYVIVMNSFIIKMSYARLVGSVAKNLILELEPFAFLLYYNIVVLVKKSK